MPNSTPNSTRHRLIESAIRRFYRDGFRNVGIDQVLADVGISKTAFYKHFESKDELMLAALEARNVWLQETFRDMIRSHGGPDPAAQLRGLFDVVERVINSDEFQGCIFVNAAMEFPLAHEPAHLAAAEHKRAIESIVRELAAEANADDPAAMAQDLCLIIEGAYVTRQVTGDPQTIAIARRVAESVIGKRLPTTAPSGVA
ncbi:TetR/AcrR family transcriptional regulator [Lacipirellula limnantheis]|uniref:HTH-type transcriptional regulator YjdC n=1 Tax=Lacipirellula limnantheis TaxID=2528024 RepID=A0A517TU60_9BACT|nr:TetR/AcrR family transcriptional regulator [Lacipirellula limnantheis]QDT71906.1 HTH-type transcriptional regulator YjdC [Lacipirellula limnantheis]